jgi:hypothetical protein
LVAIACGVSSLRVDDQERRSVEGTHKQGLTSHRYLDYTFCLEHQSLEGH